MDPMGLARRSQVASGKIFYSCRCGWIDYGHADGFARDIINGMKNAKRDSLKSLTRPGYKITATWSIGKDFGPIRVGSGGSKEYYVNENKLHSKRIMLSLFRDASVASEQWQRSGTNFALAPQVRNSSFSEEDLPSNLTSFYSILFGLARRDIENYCDALTVQQSLKVWDEGGDAKGYSKGSTPWTNNSYWKPVYKDGVSKTAKSCCANKPLSGKWPMKLRFIKDIDRSDDTWDDWRYQHYHSGIQRVPNPGKGIDQLKDTNVHPAL